MIRILSCLVITLLLLSALAGCTSSRLSSAADPVTYTITSDGELQVRDLVRTARVLAKHRDLTDTELDEVRKRLSRIFEGLVTLELESLRKQEAAQARKEGRRVRNITRADARQQLLERLGKDLAVPVLSNENRSAVAFGRVEKDGVEVNRTAYEIDQPVADLPPGSRITTPERKKAALLAPNPLP